MQFGEGAAFAGATKSSSVEAPNRPRFQGSGRLLVVDDEPAVARLTGLVLGQHGFEVEVVVSGQEALTRIASVPNGYRLVLVDLTMPDLTGIEVLHRARALGCHAPMVLTSGYSEKEAAASLEGTDFVGYLQKPYRLEALLDVVERALVEAPSSDA